MKIETYEVELIDQSEIQALAADGEMSQLIEDLGLTGQSKLLGVDLQPFPYRIMTKEEQVVFSIIFSQRTKLTEFSSELIPLRVLQVAAHVKSTNFIDKEMWVWHPEDSRHDPLLVGHASIPGSQWGERYFLLARWGAALLPFSALRDKAKVIWSAERKTKLAKAEMEFKLLKDTVSNDADLYLSGKSITTSVYF